MTQPQKAPPWSLLATLLAGTFIGTLGNSMISIALPALKDHFQVPLTTAVWTITLYTLTFSVLMPVFGTLGPAIGYKRMFMSGILLVVAGSVITVLATNFTLFLAARVMTGIGIGTVLPTIMGVIANRFPVHLQGQATGYWALVNSFAHAVGPSLGGVLLRFLGWQGLFLLNLPIGLATIAIAWVLFPPNRKVERVRFDLGGAVAVVLMAFCAMIAITRTAKEGLLAALPLTLWLTALASLVFILFYERRRAAPFIDLKLFTNRKYIAALLSISMQAFTQFGLLVSLPVFLIDLHGVEKEQAGLIIMVMTLSMAVLSPVSGRLADRVGSRVTCMLGALLVGSGAVYFTLTRFVPQQGWGWAVFLLGLVIFGLGFGFVQSSATVSVLQSVPPEKSGPAAGFFHMMRFVMGSLGSTIFGILLEMNSSGMLAGFYVSFWVVLGVALLVFPFTSWLPSKTGMKGAAAGS